MFRNLRLISQGRTSLIPSDSWVERGDVYAEITPEFNHKRLKIHEGDTKDQKHHRRTPKTKDKKNTNKNPIS